ncbi:hypothetical protein [Mesorhizobium sp. STM 4661]|uniref:hypothetical protein n=1 Tax=Mesorhizobium sp. STM 4661 TaxID=1297570 RepID=UPI0002C023F0|nr:hypothetical protein [Mesorhizobium sp. STM 4661]CCV16368.1 hypothetical protein MESS4_p20021 [Mesorhizobium sp. STM 4661]
MSRRPVRRCRISPIIYVPADRAAKYRDSDLHWINECVAVGDLILMLFEANTDEVFVDRVRRAEAQPGQDHSYHVSVSATDQVVAAHAHSTYR